MLGVLFSGLAAIIKIAGPVVTSFATQLVAKLPTIVETALEVLKVIGPIVKDIAEIIGVLKNGDDVEELGKKAMQEGTRPKMEEESMEDYFEYLRNEVKLDEERWKNMTDAERLQANVTGVSMVTTAISEKTKVDLSPDFIMAMKEMEMTAQQVCEYIKTFSEKNIDSMDSFTDYLRGELSGDSKKEVFNAIEETESKLHPDYSDGDILVEINSMKDKLCGAV